MKKVINSFDLTKGDLLVYDLNTYCKNVVVLNHHYMSDIVFLDKIRENARKLGYVYERKLETLDYEEDRKQQKIPPLYEKLSVFTKIDTENSDEFPTEKIAVYRAFEYHAEHMDSTNNGRLFFRIRRPVLDDKRITKVYEDYIRLFCGAEGFDYNETYVINPINTILIVILDNIRWVPEAIFPDIHKNFVLFTLISTSSPHEIFIAPDLRANKDSQYQKKIEELKFLLGIEDDNSNKE